MARNACPRRKGFSLIELIVALAIVSVAGTVFVSFYTSSIDLGRTAQNRTVAAQLAREQLNTILRHPEKFQWQVPAEAGTAAFPIVVPGEDTKVGNPVQLPAVQPPNENSFQRNAAVYDKFHWMAQGRFPDANSAYCEVTVTIQWPEAVRPQMLALTSAVPRFQIPAGGSK